jgi:hypothetical protein
MVGWLAGWLSAGVVGAVAAGLVVLAVFPAPTGLPLGFLAGVGGLVGAGLLFAGWTAVVAAVVIVAAAVVAAAALAVFVGLPLGVGGLGGAGLFVAGWTAVVAAVVTVAAAAVAAAALAAFVGLPLGFCVCDLCVIIAGPAAMLGAAALWLAVWLGLGGLNLAGVVAAVVSGSVVVVGLGFFLGLPRPLDV